VKYKCVLIYRELVEQPTVTVTIVRVLALTVDNNNAY